MKIPRLKVFLSRLLVAVLLWNAVVTPAIAQQPPMTREQMERAANAAVTAFQSWSELQLLEQFAKLTADWEAAFRQFGTDLQQVGERITQADRELDALENSSADAINLGALVHASYQVAVLKSDSSRFASNVAKARAAWSGRCGTDSRRTIVEATLTRASQAFAPFRIHMDGPSASFGLCGSAQVASASVQNQPRVTPTAQGSSSSDTVTAICGAGMAAGAMVGAGIELGTASAAAIMAGVAAGAATLGVGIGVVVAIAVVSMVSYQAYVNMMGEYYRNSTEFQNAVAAQWEGLRTRLNGQAVNHCAQWMGDVSDDLTTPLFATYDQRLGETNAAIAGIDRKRELVIDRLHERFLAYLQSLPQRMLEWQGAHLDFLRTLLTQLRNDDPVSVQYARQRAQPATEAISNTRRTGLSSAMLQAQAEDRYWDLLINGDVAYRKQPGWSFQSDQPLPTETYGLRSGWDAWVETTRARTWR